MRRQLAVMLIQNSLQIQNSKGKGQNYKVKFKSDIRERCYAFSLLIIALADTLPQKRSAWIITDQLIRSATSIGANLIEAKASSSRSIKSSMKLH